MSSLNYLIPKTLAIGLGSNINSSFGSPQATLIKAKPILEKTISNWIKVLHQQNQNQAEIELKTRFLWSPLYSSKPLGGPKGQPDFTNAVLVIRGEEFGNIKPTEEAAKDLLKRCLAIECQFGRNRQASTIHWGPRCLDIDLIAWGNLQINTKELIIPHPNFIDRDFILIPLAEALKKASQGLSEIAHQKGWE